MLSKQFYSNMIEKCCINKFKIQNVLGLNLLMATNSFYLDPMWLFASCYCETQGSVFSII